MLEVQVRAVGWQRVAAQRNGAGGRVAGTVITVWGHGEETEEKEKSI